MARRVGKSTPDTKPAQTAVGTEHWITIHPHGEDEKGIPVLVRENGDGTASIIGGAGHHLDQVRIGEKGRIGRGGKAKPPRQWDPGAVSEEQANQAREAKALAQGLLREAQGRIEDHISHLIDTRGAIVEGAQVKWKDLSPGEQKEMVHRATKDSLYQSTYGQLADVDRAEAPVGPILVSAAPKVHDKEEEAEDLDEKGDDLNEPESPEVGDDEDVDETPKAPAKQLRLALSTRMPMPSTRKSPPLARYVGAFERPTRYWRGRPGQRTAQDSTGRLSTPPKRPAARQPAKPRPSSTASC